MSVNTSMVWFVGAGPGDPELMTVKGQHLLAEADLILYAGSLVPKHVMMGAKKKAKIIDSSSLTLEETHALLRQTVQQGGMAIRLQSGDPSLYGTLHEQTALLDQDNIPWGIVPGVTSAFAAAAAAKASFTFPEMCQTFIITRLGGKTSGPDSDEIKVLATQNASLAIYLSGGHVEHLQKLLLEAGLPASTLIVIAHRASQPDEKIIRTSLQEVVEECRAFETTRQTTFLIFPRLGAESLRSRLYHPEFQHGFRNGCDKIKDS